MKRSIISMGAAVALAAGAGLWAQTETSVPAVGQPAPGFAMLGSDGRAHSLRGHQGRQPVVLAFFPKAFTGG